MLSQEEFESILEYGRETRSVEFKGPGRADDRRLMAQVIKAMFAMTNHRDGGRVIIGVRQQGSDFLREGLDTEQCSTWSDHDSVADRVAEYADPSVEFSIHGMTSKNGSKYAVIQVEEFDSVPVICRKNYDPVLREGACYVRPRRKPESVPVRTAADMRDLLELATEKELRRILSTTERAGMNLVQRLTDVDRFNEQLGELK